MSVDSKRKAIRIVSFIGDAASSVLCAYFVAFFFRMCRQHTRLALSRLVSCHRFFLHTARSVFIQNRERLQYGNHHRHRGHYRLYQSVPCRVSAVFRKTTQCLLDMLIPFAAPDRAVLAYPHNGHSGKNGRQTFDSDFGEHAEHQPLGAQVKICVR